MTNTGFLYDAAGNLLNDGMHSYSYDAEGNVLSVDNGTTASYVYDALNRRVRVQTASATNEFIYDYAGRRISTWQVGGAGIEGRIYWGNQQIAFRAQNGDTYFDQKDLLGTERLRMNYAAVSAANYVSLPSGDGYTAHVSGAYGDQDNSHFALLDRDAETYTDHAQFRQYANAQGRWMSPDPYGGSYDPANPQSMNRYVYAMNNPLNNIDPTGLDENGGCDAIWHPCTIVNVNGGDGGGGDVGGGSTSGTNGGIGTGGAGNGGTGNGGGGSGGGGGGTGNSGTNGPSKLRSAYCSAIPSGRSSSSGLAFGGIGSVGGSVDTVFNYNSGQTSLFATGGGALGWNGGASSTTITGLIDNARWRSNRGLCWCNRSPRREVRRRP